MGVIGKSGSGKSKFCDELHDSTQGTEIASVYFNFPQKQADNYTISGRDFSHRTPSAKVKQAIENGEQVRYKPSSDPEDAIRQLKAIYQFAKESDREVWIFVDEAHKFASKELNSMIDDGRGHKVRFIIITQYLGRFKDSNKYADYIITTIDDTGEFLVFGASKKQRGYYEYYDMPIDDIQRLTDPVEYGFVRVKGTDVLSGPHRLRL